MTDYTLDELEAGVRAAMDKGDTETAKKLGTEYVRLEAEGKHDATEYAPPKDEGTLARIGRSSREYAKERALKPSSPIGEAGLALGEAGLSMATGTLASALGGIRGLVSPLTGEDPTQAVQSTQQALTYEPRTAGGKLATEVAGAPIALATELGKKIGGAAGGLVGEKTRLAGEAIGEALPQMAAAALPLKGAVKRLTGATPSRAAEVPVAGETYSPLRDLTPEQQARLSRQTKQGIKPTLASVTREPEQFRFEEQVANMTDSEAGKAMRQRQVDNEQATIAAIKAVDQRKSGETGQRPAATDELQTGHAVVGALKNKMDTEWKQVGGLYEKAKASGETKEIVDSRLLDNWLAKMKPEEFSTKELGTMAQKVAQLKKLNAASAKQKIGKLSVEEATLLRNMPREEAIKLAKQREGFLTVDDLEQLYRTANAISEPGKPSAKQMYAVKGIINEMTKGKGGDLYREARQARLNFGKKWENQKSVADLVSTKGSYSTDPKVAAEKVFGKTVLSGSLQDLQNVTRTLMDGDLKQFPQGPQAMREMQSRTINHLIEKATVGDMDNPRIATVKFRNEVKRIGRDKLNHLLGKESVDKLYDSIRTLEETQTKPGRATGSDTFLNFKMEQNRNIGKLAMDHLLSEVPFYIRIPAKLGIKKLEKKAEETARKKSLEEGVQEALQPRRAAPSVIAETGAKERMKQRQYRMEERKPALLPAAVGAEAGMAEERRAREEAKRMALEEATQ